MAWTLKKCGNIRAHWCRIKLCGSMLEGIERGLRVKRNGLSSSLLGGESSSLCLVPSDLPYYRPKIFAPFSILDVGEHKAQATRRMTSQSRETRRTMRWAREMTRAMRGAWEARRTMQWARATRRMMLWGRETSRTMLQIQEMRRRTRRAQETRKTMHWV